MAFLRIRLDPEPFRRKMIAAGAAGRDRIVPAIVAECDVVAEDARRDWPSLSGRSAAGITVVRTTGGGRVDNAVPYAAWVRPRGDDAETAWHRYVVVPMLAAYDRLVSSILPAIVREVLR